MKPFTRPRLMLAIFAGCLLGSGAAWRWKATGETPDGFLGRTDYPSVNQATGGGRKTGIPQTMHVLNAEEMMALQEKARRALTRDFYAPGTTMERKLEILRQLINGAGIPAELIAMIDSLPEIERSPMLSLLGQSCASDDPELYFAILDRLPSGNYRSTVIGSGVEELEPENAKRLIHKLIAEDDAKDLNELTTSVYHLSETSRLKPAELLEFVGQSEADDLDEMLLYAAGRLSVVKPEGVPTIEEVRLKWGDELAVQYARGQLAEKMNTNADAFLAALPDSCLSSQDQSDMADEFAGETVVRQGIGEVLRRGEKLSGALADTYYRAVGRNLSAMDSMQASTVLRGLPAGRPRDMMTAQLVIYLDKTGATADARMWEQTIEDAGIRESVKPKR